MTPKSRAKKIIKKFQPHAKDWDCYWDVPLEFNHAKACALIAVKSIIDKHKDDWDVESEYWQQVKAEIEKL